MTISLKKMKDLEVYKCSPRGSETTAGNGVRVHDRGEVYEIGNRNWSDGSCKGSRGEKNYGSEASDEHFDCKMSKSGGRGDSKLVKDCECTGNE